MPNPYFDYHDHVDHARQGQMRTRRRKAALIPATMLTLALTGALTMSLNGSASPLDDGSKTVAQAIQSPAPWPQAGL